MSICGWLVRDKFLLVKLGVLSLVAVNAVFHLTSELSDQTLDGPRCGITKCANSVTLDLVGEFF